MKLKDIGEFGFIEKISQGCLIRPDRVIRAIGDDAAAFFTDTGLVSVVTTDLLVERVHFIRDATTGFNLGYKSLAVNLSDIAAMGATAREAFVSVAIPEDCATDFLEEVYRGIKDLAGKFNVNILGGDTTLSMKDLIINISVSGSVPKEELLLRNAARRGDIIFATGFLGDSRAGLHLILNHITADSKEFKQLFHSHILPRPFLSEGRFLASQTGVHAAIDVSDGLSSDIGHIATESNVGVSLYAEKIPVSTNLKYFCNRFEFDPVEFALAGGEDYILLCTVSPDHADTVAQKYLKAFNRPLYSIGKITDPGKMEIIDSSGRAKKFKPKGWDHFKSK
ncbi:MAG: thiamine-phosphate kinase [Thermodesulfobacteriota bacterium]|nr:thiamine-phosphate kinase [Thermodesulfobacteriota bacterium]